MATRESNPITTRSARVDKIPKKERSRSMKNRTNEKLRGWYFAISVMLLFGISEDTNLLASIVFFLNFLNAVRLNIEKQ